MREKYVVNLANDRQDNAQKENNLSPYHYLRYLFETLPYIVLNNKEEIDKVLPWSMDLPSSSKIPRKSEENKK
ncbi:hypothetical protein [Bacillus toyonensis]|uniref:hypothetical protein n=1 Tax=Bacillus toyonensis TaxID=155322 RepID=UPI003016672E